MLGESGLESLNQTEEESTNDDWIFLNLDEFQGDDGGHGKGIMSGGRLLVQIHDEVYFNGRKIHIDEDGNFELGELKTVEISSMPQDIISEILASSSMLVKTYENGDHLAITQDGTSYYNGHLVNKDTNES